MKSSVLIPLTFLLFSSFTLVSCRKESSGDKLKGNWLSGRVIDYYTDPYTGLEMADSSSAPQSRYIRFFNNRQFDLGDTALRGTYLLSQDTLLSIHFTSNSFIGTDRDQIFQVEINGDRLSTVTSFIDVSIKVSDPSRDGHYAYAHASREAVRYFREQ